MRVLSRLVTHAGKAGALSYGERARLGIQGITGMRDLNGRSAHTGDRAKSDMQQSRHRSDL